MRLSGMRFDETEGEMGESAGKCSPADSQSGIPRMRFQRGKSDSFGGWREQSSFG